MITFLLRSPLLGQYSHFLAAIGVRSMNMGSRGLLEKPRSLFIILLMWSFCRESKGSSDPCSCTQNDQIANPNDPTCTTYLHCWNYNTHATQSCPKQWSQVREKKVHLQFNPATGNCDWPSNVDCSPDTTTPSAITATGHAYPNRCISGPSDEDWICNGR